jgi:hypothetical protein
MGSLAIPEFVKRYDNFYYYNALDGHEEGEEGKRLLAVFSDAVKLHKHVQEDVVDNLYLGEPGYLDQFKEAGRIAAQEGVARLLNILKGYDLNDMIAQLER